MGDLDSKRRVSIDRVMFVIYIKDYFETNNFRHRKHGCRFIQNGYVSIL